MAASTLAGETNIHSSEKQDDSFPVPGSPLTILDVPLQIPAIVFGAGTFANQYNADDYLASDIPVRTVGVALRYGIRAFDTSVYYGPSEMVLGNALDALKDEFPRPSYLLMTKCGRYGPEIFDYTPATIHKSVQRSLARLKTSYLDVVYLHDVEFVCTAVTPQRTGNHTTALKDDALAYGLAEGDEAKIRGEGDQKVVDAFTELRKMQEEGLIKHIGITGYPLATLLRLAILILHTPPYKPVDILLSYSHLSLQNSTFLEFMPHFYRRAKVVQLVTASPFSMGLLTPSPPPWHPAPEKLHQAVGEASKIWPAGLPNLALGHSIRHTGAAHGNIPLVVGFSTPREVHECMGVWREVQSGINDEERKKGENEACILFKQSQFLDWSWASPGP